MIRFKYYIIEYERESNGVITNETIQIGGYSLIEAKRSAMDELYKIENGHNDPFKIKIKKGPANILYTCN